MPGIAILRFAGRARSCTASSFMSVKNKQSRAAPAAVRCRCRSGGDTGFAGCATAQSVPRNLRTVGPAATPGEADLNILQALDAAAQRLGNTRTVCRKYYVHPVPRCGATSWRC